MFLHTSGSTVGTVHAPVPCPVSVSHVSLRSSSLHMLNDGIMRASAVLVDERRAFVCGCVYVGKDCSFALRGLVRMCSLPCVIPSALCWHASDVWVGGKRAFVCG